MSRTKQKYRLIRYNFRRDLYDAIINNRALGMLCIVTYEAQMHRKHIMKIWSMSARHPSFHEKYSESLFGKHLTGTNEIFRSIYFSAPDLYEKYAYKIPEDFAMGDALSVARRAMVSKDKVREGEQ